MIRYIQLFVIASWFLVVPLSAQSSSRLESRVSELESKTRNLPVVEVGGAAFLAGAFCALWAQNTGRSSWLWFFLGLLFSPIAIIVLLVKNSRALEEQRLTAHLRR